MTVVTSKNAFFTRHKFAALIVLLIAIFYWQVSKVAPDIFYVYSLLLLIILHQKFLLPLTKPSNLIAEFAAITNETFEQINTFDLPGT